MNYKFADMKTKILFGLVLIILISCDEEENKPSDKFTLSSSQYKGFLFEEMQIINFSNTNDSNPDFVVLAQTDENGDIVSPFLTHPELERRFYLSNSFENYEKALSSYNNFAISENYHLRQSALNIEPNQIWLIKTNSEKFGVVLIKSTEYNKDNDTPYAETTFKAKKIN